MWLSTRATYLDYIESGFILMLSIRATAIAVLVVLSHGSAQAGEVLEEFGTKFLVPGEVLEHPVVINRDSGRRLEIKLIDAPRGARLVVTDDGRMLLQWLSMPRMASMTPLVVQARDVDTQSVVDTSILVVRNTLTLENNTITAEVQQESTQPSVNPESLPSVSLKPIHGQIVSTGRVISLRIEGASSDNKEPVIHIDRIPRNASFEQNEQGSYNFYWQTSRRDDGEHLFRVTAQHPDNHAVIASRDLTIVVGNPSIKKTVPVDMDGSGS